MVKISLYSGAVALAAVCGSTESAYETSAAVDRWLVEVSLEELENVIGHRFRSWRRDPERDVRHRLMRWAVHPPEQIFRTGFVPVADLSILRSENTDGIRSVTNLKNYVANNITSVFVSTTAEQSNHEIYQFRNPRPYGYEIFAPGGLDVNLELGRHKFQRQNEIAFFGGIRTEFIMGVVKINVRNGRMVGYEFNERFQQPERQEPLTSRFRCCTHDEDNLILQNEMNNNKNNTALSTGTGREQTDENRQCYINELPPCFMWYKIQVNSPRFYQDGESTIEPYGRVTIQVGEGVAVSLWRVPYDEAGDEDPSSEFNDACILAGVKDLSTPPQVCIETSVREYDPTPFDSDENISEGTKCGTGNIRVPGPDGYVQVTVEQERCNGCHVDTDCQVYYAD